MDQIVIEGGYRLSGEIPISGAKNSAIKLMAACLLTKEALILENMPRLRDTRFMGQLLARLGVDIEEGPGARMRLDAAKLDSVTAPYDLVRQMRATFNVLGPLLAREGKAKVSLPGGCAIGARPVDLHLKAFEAMGADIRLEDGYVIANAKNGLSGANIAFPFVSVGATEHTLLAAVLASGQTILSNAAREPEIEDLAECLIAMGAKIEGAGTSEITIQGVSSLSGITHAVVPDRIETGTYALAAASAGGNVTLTGMRPEQLRSLWPLMERAGVGVELHDTSVTILRGETRLHAVDVDTQPYPGFPTDCQAQFMALMAKAKGTSLIRENIFENRFMHAPELSRMGADITVKGQEAVVRGVETLTGATVMATDLRASVSLIIAALAAKGTTKVRRVYHLDRGFERLEDKLRNVGAKIVRESE